MYEYNVPFMFVIDTDSYAGNFEREMCAYITGFWDGETHGGDQAAIFKKEIGEERNPFEDYVVMTLTQDDDVPCIAPMCLEQEPNGGAMNSIGIFFEEEPTIELITLMKNRAYKFSQEGLIFGRPVRLKIIGFRLFKKTVTIQEISIGD